MYFPCTRIKFCGITNLIDARAAVEYGADALGFIRVEGSPRYVSDRQLDELAETYPFVGKVIVVRRPEDASEIDPKGFRYVQHYEESADDEKEGKQGWGYEASRYIRAFRIREQSDIEEMERYPLQAGMRAYLLDTYHKDQLGGSGETFDWELAVEAKRRFPDKRIILAGGLTPQNVGEAIRRVRPYAVDVSSGVEAEPGRKDHAKLRAFVAAVRAADTQP